jgi:hypothetical protein
MGSEEDGESVRGSTGPGGDGVAAERARNGCRRWRQLLSGGLRPGGASAGSGGGCVGFGGHCRRRRSAGRCSERRRRWGATGFRGLYWVVSGVLRAEEAMVGSRKCSARFVGGRGSGTGWSAVARSSETAPAEGCTEKRERETVGGIDVKNGGKLC